MASFEQYKKWINEAYLYPAESPAVPVERALAGGWVRENNLGRRAGCWECKAQGLSEFAKREGPCGRLLYCPPCAEKAGAFATPAPTVTPEPAPKPAPRCEYRTAAHEGTPVERVMFHGGAPKRMFACDACYLYSEAEFPVQWRDGTPDNRPRATVGVVPVVFGLSVGILSRGMR